MLVVLDPTLGLILIPATGMLESERTLPCSLAFDSSYSWLPGAMNRPKYPVFGLRG